MPKITLNLARVADLEAIPAGLYSAKIFEMTPGRSKAGNPKISVVFVVTEGDYAETRVFHNLTLVPQAMPFVKRFLKAFYDKEDLNQEEFELDTDDLVGRECRIRVSVEVRDGEKQNRVGSVLPIGDETSVEDFLDEDPFATLGDGSVSLDDLTN